MMELAEAIQKRRSVRGYKPDPVPIDVLDKIVVMACTAPSAGAIRGYKIIQTTEQLTRYESPVALVVCAIPEQYRKRYGPRGVDLYSVQDATLVAGYIQLLAVDYGLATVWVGAFREGKIKRTLGLGDDLRPIAIVLMGYEED